MKLTTIGLDLAEAVFQVHGADERGRAVLKKQLKRAQVLAFFANLTPCKLALEAWQCPLLGAEAGSDGT